MDSPVEQHWGQVNVLSKHWRSFAHTTGAEVGALVMLVVTGVVGDSEGAVDGEGASVALTVGESDGTGDSAAEGTSDGCNELYCVARLGASEGTSVGNCEGGRDGLIDGSCEGGRDGPIDGVSEL